MKKLWGEVESRIQNPDSRKREMRSEKREKFLNIKPYPPALMLRWRKNGKTIIQETKIKHQ